MTRIRKIIKNNYEYILCFILFGVILFIAINPSRYISATFSAISIWAKLVLPSLFCFFFLTKIFMSLGKGIDVFAKMGRPFAKLYNNSDLSLYIFLMSIISGYPVGVKLIAQFRDTNYLTYDEAKKLLPLASTSGPMFILGTIVSMTGDRKSGIIILICHILSSLITGLIFRGHDKKLCEKTSKDIIFPQKIDINAIMYDTIISVFMVGGYIAICFTLLELVSGINFILHSEIVIGVFKGLIEMTTGCIYLANAHINPNLLNCLLSLLITFGGLSIHLQSNIFLKQANIKYGYFLIVKVCQSIIALILTYIMCAVT